MKCPYCFNTETKVLDKREGKDKAITRRRRECLKCQKRFTTYERIASIEIIVIKKDGRREPFDKEKIRNGIKKACSKRPITQEQVDELADKIEMKIRNYKKNEISSTKIGEILMKKLRKLDEVAYIRFASVYRDFGDVNSFEKEVKTLKGGK